VLVTFVFDFELACFVFGGLCLCVCGRLRYFTCCFKVILVFVVYFVGGWLFCGVFRFECLR